MYRLLSWLFTGCWLLAVILLVGGLITALTIRNSPDVSFKGLNCDRYEVMAGIDAPLGSLIDLIGGKRAITAQRGATFTLTLFTIFRVPVTRATYECLRA